MIRWCVLALSGCLWTDAQQSPDAAVIADAGPTADAPCSNGTLVAGRFYEHQPPQRRPLDVIVRMNEWPDQRAIVDENGIYSLCVPAFASAPRLVFDVDLPDEFIDGHLLIESASVPLLSFAPILTHEVVAELLASAGETPDPRRGIVMALERTSELTLTGGAIGPVFGAQSTQPTRWEPGYRLGVRLFTNVQPGIMRLERPADGFTRGVPVSAGSITWVEVPPL